MENGRHPLLDDLHISTTDIIALIALIGCLVLLFTGQDGEVKAMVGAILGYYFRGVKNKVNGTTR